jgi:hypothetical protein
MLYVASAAWLALVAFGLIAVPVGTLVHVVWNLLAYGWRLV